MILAVVVVVVAVEVELEGSVSFCWLNGLGSDKPQGPKFCQVSKHLILIRIE